MGGLCPDFPISIGEILARPLFTKNVWTFQIEYSLKDEDLPLRQCLCWRQPVEMTLMLQCDVSSVFILSLYFTPLTTSRFKLLTSGCFHGGQSHKFPFWHFRCARCQWNWMCNSGSCNVIELHSILTILIIFLFGSSDKLV